MANKYANLVGTNKIKDEYTKINTGFDGVETDIKAVNTRVDTIITTPIEGAAQEIVEARVSAVKGKTFATLDARFEETEQDIATHKADIVQTDEVNSSTKYPSAAVTYAHGQEIDSISATIGSFKLIESGTIAQDNSRVVALTERSLHLLFTYKEMSSMSTGVYIVGVLTSGIYAIGKLHDSAKATVTYEGNNLTITNVDAGALWYKIYRI